MSKKMGRPTIFDKAVADEICERLFDGESLRSICKDDHLPKAATVFRWLADGQHSHFKDQYDAARLAQAHGYVEKIIEIAEGAGREGRDESGAVSRDRLQVDALKWFAGKLAPKYYGDKVDLTSNGGPLVVNIQKFSGD